IKISDLAKHMTAYSDDYYTCRSSNNGSPLPIRWMAPEVLLLNKKTIKSDVWSFAVTFWEILTLNRTKPYDWLTNEQLIERLHSSSSFDLLLPQPAPCPKEIYDMLLQCWSPDPDKRPNFSDLHFFIQ
ncbi:hypothetical protein HELRODRAFT_146217, partial [Helobdella robusta]|uniref:Protein kinase domain-containing protein n=1 Tax=Helobdella robusta TaxID=6412 RepID=T1EJQ9_HELRO